MSVGVGFLQVFNVDRWTVAERVGRFRVQSFTSASHLRERIDYPEPVRHRGRARPRNTGSPRQPYRGQHLPGAARSFREPGLPAALVSRDPVGARSRQELVRPDLFEDVHATGRSRVQRVAFQKLHLAVLHAGATIREDVATLAQRMTSGRIVFFPEPLHHVAVPRRFEGVF
jgi:hypothetical protein